MKGFLEPFPFRLKESHSQVIILANKLKVFLTSHSKIFHGRKESQLRSIVFQILIFFLRIKSCLINWLHPFLSPLPFFLEIEDEIFAQLNAIASSSNLHIHLNPTDKLFS